MGTWGIGPFDNDTAADFAYKLDAAALNERAGLVRGVLTRTATTSGYLTEAQQAVAVAALIAAQCPVACPLIPTVLNSRCRSFPKIFGRWRRRPWIG